MKFYNYQRGSAVAAAVAAAFWLGVVVPLLSSPSSWSVSAIHAKDGVTATTTTTSSASSSNNNHFRVVLDSPIGNEKKTRLMIKKMISSSGGSIENVRAAIENLKAKTANFSDEAKEIVEAFKDNLKKYSKKEIGLYAAMTLALTVTFKMVFTKSSTTTVDLRKISYILSSSSADSIVSQTPTQLIGLRNNKSRQRCGSSSNLKLTVTPSITSSDGKTYIRTVKKALKMKKQSPPSLPPPPNNGLQSLHCPAHVSVSTFYSDQQQFDDDYNRNALPASHNAVIDSMSPSMRKSIKASKRLRVPRGGSAAKSALMQRLEIVGYFAAWYALNVVYNIINKKVLNVLPTPLIVGSIQFGIGATYCILLWLFKLRDAPKLNSTKIKKSVASVGAYHMLGQLSTMIALEAAPVSFSHIVKALEPFFSAIISGLYFHKWMKPQVYATLIPVVGGVGYACLKEINFSWIALSGAMASNLFFAMRAVLSKAALLESSKEDSSTGRSSNLTAPNMFGLVTISAFLLSIPVALLKESSGFLSVWSTAMDKVDSKSQFVRALFVSGLFHYLNNEVMYMALSNVHPVTLAVGNTMKRVFILVASVMVFRNPISTQGIVGSAVGISGVLLYSLTKQYYESLEQQQQQQESKKLKTKGRRRR